MVLAEGNSQYGLLHTATFRPNSDQPIHTPATARLFCPPVKISTDFCLWRGLLYAPDSAAKIIAAKGGVMQLRRYS